VLPRRLALALAAALALSACRHDCGDDEWRDAEICFLKHVLEVEPGAEGPLAVRAADFDGDAHDDILVIGVGGGGVGGSLHLGDGDGHLGDARDAAVAGCSAYPVAGDLDQDGAADLLFATCADSLLMYRADGSGGFAPAVELSVGLNAITTAVADLDGDGRRDILVLGDAAGVPALGLVLADGAGGFLAPQLVALIVPGLDAFEPDALAAGRVVRDGVPEVVVGELGRSGGLARAAVRDGVLGAPTAIATGLRPAGLSLRDLDDDDDLDLLVLDRSPDAMVALLGPDLSEGPRTALGSLPRSIALAHLDGDGSVDAVLMHGARLGLWRGVGDGRFVAHREVEFPADVVELALPDLNGDGRSDLVAGLFPDGGLVVRLSGP
jgi:hypothetical protein